MATRTTPAHPPAPSPASIARDSVLRLCRRGLEGCRERDGDRVRRVLMALIGMLDFRYRDAAMRMFAVYETGLRHVAQRRFDVPRAILATLQAELDPRPVPPPSPVGDARRIGGEPII
jgi:hypothetical protein